MKVLIVEDSLGLVQVYTGIIKHIVKKLKPNETLEVVSVANNEEYYYFKHMGFDLAILDWNIIGGTSESIIQDAIGKIAYSYFITGYANNKRVRELSKQFNIPIMSKPSTELEIIQILERAIEKIYNGITTMVSEKV